MKKSVLIGVIVGAVVLVCIVLGAIFLMPNDNNSTTTTRPTTTTTTTTRPTTTTTRPTTTTTTTRPTTTTTTTRPTTTTTRPTTTTTTTRPTTTTTRPTTTRPTTTTTTTTVNSDTSRFDWERAGKGCGAKIPEPTLPYDIKASSSYIIAQVHNITEDDFLEYVNSCRDYGFDGTVESATSPTLYYMEYNSEGYYLEVFYYESEEYFSIYISPPKS